MYADLIPDNLFYPAIIIKDPGYTHPLYAGNTFGTCAATHLFITQEKFMAYPEITPLYIAHNSDELVSWLETTCYKGRFTSLKVFIERSIWRTVDKSIRQMEISAEPIIMAMDPLTGKAMTMNDLDRLLAEQSQLQISYEYHNHSIEGLESGWSYGNRYDIHKYGYVIDHMKKPAVLFRDTALADRILQQRQNDTAVKRKKLTYGLSKNELERLAQNLVWATVPCLGVKRYCGRYGNGIETKYMDECIQVILTHTKAMPCIRPLIGKEYRIAVGHIRQFLKKAEPKKYLVGAIKRQTRIVANNQDSQELNRLETLQKQQMAVRKMVRRLQWFIRQEDARKCHGNNRGQSQRAAKRSGSDEPSFAAAERQHHPAGCSSDVP